MFEKDAEEYYYKKVFAETNPKNETELKEKFLQTFKDSAEFGYNKANEWHYVKDELPDFNGQFYVALKGSTETFILNYDYDEYDESKMVWLDDDGTNFDDEVYAWHEKLKAPKESE